MKNMLDSLQDVLLVFSIILLVYVLYSRLLLLLGKNKNKRAYAMTGEKLEWKDGRTAIVEVDIPSAMHVDILVFNAENTQVLQAVSEDCEPGKKYFEVNCSSLKEGRYYLKVISESQESSLYFNLE